MSDDPIREAFMKRYGRIYDPSANAAAIEEQNAQIARRVRQQQLYRERPKRDE